MTDARRFELLLDGLGSKRVPFPDPFNRSVKLICVEVISGHWGVNGVGDRVEWEMEHKATDSIPKVSGDMGNPAVEVKRLKGYIDVIWPRSMNVRGVRVRTNMGNYYHHVGAWPKELPPSPGLRLIQARPGAWDQLTEDQFP